jgi:hypothetical protein
MLAPGLVVIGKDDDLSAEEVIGVAISPRPGAHRVARGDEAALHQGVDVLLTLRDENPVIQDSGAVQLLEAVENGLDPLEVPDRLTIGPGPPLAEVLWIKPDDFEDEIALYVAVGVDRDDLSLWVWLPPRPPRLGIGRSVLSPARTLPLKEMRVGVGSGTSPRSRNWSRPCGSFGGGTTSSG